MKRPYEVQFVQTHESLRWIVMDDAWSVRKDFRWKWMERLAHWLIRKIGVNAREPSVEVQRIVIDPADVMHKIIEQKRAMIDMSREPKRVLIGADDFAEMMHTIRPPDAFEISAEYYRGDGYGTRRVYGLMIEVIPWMRGVLVMP